MGRYYSGDINGKFGFGSQDSTDGEYFGAINLDYSHIPYMIPSKEIPKAIRKLRGLIDQYRKETGNTTLTLDTTGEEFGEMIDIDWYQDSKNGLLASRIYMGIEILKFSRECPGQDIYFDAEI